MVIFTVVLWICAGRIQSSHYEFSWLGTLCEGFSWPWIYAAKWFGLKVISVWAVRHTSLHYLQHTFFNLHIFANVTTPQGVSIWLEAVPQWPYPHSQPADVPTFPPLSASWALPHGPHEAGPREIHTNIDFKTNKLVIWSSIQKVFWYSEFCVAETGSILPGEKRSLGCMNLQER